MLTMSTAGNATSDNHLDNGANAGFTLTINATITGATGFEGWRATADHPGGLIVLGNAANDYTFNNALAGGMQYAVVKLADAGQPSSLGAGSYVGLSGGPQHRLIYTGSGDSTDRDYRLNGNPTRFVQAGSGPLVFTGPVRSTPSSAVTLTLDGDASAAEARISGPISQNGTNALSVIKEGSGTWVLDGSNTFSGTLTVNAGALGLDATTNAFGRASAIIVNTGATLAINPSATDGYAVTLPPVNGFGAAAVTVARAATSSAVTFSALNVAGSLANRIFLKSLPSGVVGPWLTLNGGAAAYDPVNGLVPATATSASLATKGSVLPDGADIQAVIDSVGTGADIALSADPTRLYSLTQTVAGDAATVSTAGKTLYAGELAIASGAAALTIGALPRDGVFLPPVTEFAAPVIPRQAPQWPRWRRPSGTTPRMPLPFRFTSALSLALSTRAPPEPL
ncbi:MAG TPA: autotransporter-associated beta strand repeat-containing protein [Kiritimatiellia bacterium]|nr:autotransporter-associated beta strand repeat-containing protein [Kiritimatiellia bacterium]HRU70078.1 autotransporter-associated beta strand repeat-containing protein [Kiritimatiellia bacterium]